MLGEEEVVGHLAAPARLADRVPDVLDDHHLQPGLEGGEDPRCSVAHVGVAVVAALGKGVHPPAPPHAGQGALERPGRLDPAQKVSAVEAAIQRLKAIYGRTVELDPPYSSTSSAL